MRLVVFITLIASTARADTPQDSLPPELQTRATQLGLLKAHDFDVRLNPYYLRGDFDGDGKADHVVGMMPKSPSATRRFVVVPAVGSAHWLDQDDQLRYPPMEHSPAWHVVDRSTKIEQSAHDDAKPPKLRGDAILFIKVEASSSLVYWNGKRFVSYWQAD